MDNIQALEVQQLYSHSLVQPLPFDFAKLSDIFGNELQRDISRIGDLRGRSSALAELYTRSRANEFHDLYKDILGWIYSQIRQPFIYQPHPTFRIQWPGTRAGNFHVDSWVGHGSSTLNFWVPLTDLSDSSCVWMASSANSRLIKSRFVNERLSVAEYEALAAPLMEPRIVPIGSFLTFNDDNLHGSIISSDRLPRVSFDFRTALHPYEIGVKKIGIDYLTFTDDSLQLDSRTSSMIPVKTIVFTSGELLHLSHQTQRQIISDFCASRMFVPEREASEYYGTNHFPQISQWVFEETNKDKSARMPIVLTSQRCFREISSIIRLCQSSGVELYDALANSRIC